MIKNFNDPKDIEIKEKSDKKPVCFFTACDEKNFRYAISFLNSLTKFHSPKDIDIVIYTTEKRAEELKKLPEGVIVVDLTPYLVDQAFWYRQKPLLAEPLLDKYDLVVGFDADQLVLGSLDYIIETDDYDVGTVINWNRHDEKLYPLVQGWGILPAEYFNCGLVALRSKKFAHDWNVLCHSPQFDRLQYKEQDLLNGLIYFGNWNVRCFDHGDPVKKLSAWFGIIGKGEWNRAKLINNEVVVPKGLGDTPFPPADMIIKIAHLGGGTGVPKDNWGSFFPAPVMERIAELIK